MNRIKRIQRKRGSGMILMGVYMSLLALLLCILVSEYANVMYGEVLAVSRCDTIADSAAVYAQSYDYAYNKNDARDMAYLLSELNNEALGDNLTLSSTITFPADNILSVQCYTQIPTGYEGITGDLYYYASHTTSVKSVDVYGDIFVVP